MTTSNATPDIKVLLVHDKPGDDHPVREMLRGQWVPRFSLEPVTGFAAGLERLKAPGVDVVILDVDPSDREGLATVAHTYAQATEAPILVLTGLRDPELAVAAVREGAQDCLFKDRVDGELLRRRIRYAIERKRAMANIRWLTAAVEQSPASVLMTGLDGAIEYVNPAFTTVTGYTSAEAIGQNPRMLQSGLTPVGYYRNLWETILAGKTWRAEILNRRKNGELYWDAVTIAPIRDARGVMTHFLAVQVEVTERKRAEEALRGSEKRLRTLFETVNLIVLGLDAEGRVDYVNPFYLHLTGYAPEEVLGKSWFQFLPERERPPTADVFRELLQREVYAHHENAILTKAGPERIIAWNNTLVRDAQGRPAGTLSIGEDVTERLHLEEQFRQAQKMEAVGRLAGGVAHDFNNLLTAITGYTDLVRQDLHPGDPHRADLDEVRNAADRAAALTRQLLAFSRRQVLQPRVLDLNEVVTGMEKLLRRTIGEDVVLDARLAPDLPGVRADPGQLEQVIMNLAVNSRDAMPDGGRLTIETGLGDLDDTYAASHPGARPGRYVLMAFTDTGQGMDQETQKHVFEPFFTTKGPGKGTGLGLATVYGIVKQSEGYVAVYSEVGVGTSMKVYLPVAEGAAQRIAPPASEASTPSGTETILLVEDEEGVSALALKLLERRGYTVLRASGGAEAVALGRAHAGAIDLLITDVVMPGMGGPECAELLVRLRPGLKVLFVSGYADAAVTGHRILDPRAPYLQKPFTPDALARKVREVLDTPPPAA